jgi:hypothetical protein
MTLYNNKLNCRLCGSNELEKILSLEPTPPANSFVEKTKINQQQLLIPLDLQFCRSCFHVQLLQVVNPEELFTDYLYVSGTSKTFLNHFVNYVKDIEPWVDTKGLVIDIGSNDGSLLNFFQENQWKVLGIDPAKNLCQLANQNNIETINDFFTKQLASEIKIKYGIAKIITANNVFAHVDNLVGILDGLKLLMDDNTIFVFEVSYLLDVINEVLFDTIYHEHLSYHSVKPLDDFFKKHDMKLINIKKVSSHGGSIRGIVQKVSGVKKTDNTVKQFINDESNFGLYKVNTYKFFEKSIKKLKFDLMFILNNHKKNNKKIFVYGAPAKATTLMYYFGLDSKIIDFIIDDNPLKQNMLSPGLHVPVVSSDVIEKDKPDIIVILAWNFADSIIKINKNFINSGGTFIVPLPEIREITKL